MAEQTNDTNVSQDDLFASLFEDTPAESDEGGDHLTDILSDDKQDAVDPAAPPADDKQDTVDLETKYRVLSEEAEQLRAYAPIVRFLESNPDAMNNLIQNVKGNVQQQAKQEVVKPTRPVKPANYDPLDEDVNSESFKYRQAVEEYPLLLAEYHEKVYAQKESELSELLNKQKEDYQRTEQQKSNYQYAINKGLNAQQAQKFLKFMDDPKAVNLDSLIQLFLFNEQPPKDKAKVDNKIQTMSQRTQRSASPLPAGVQPGQSAPQYDDNDLFNISLLRMGNRGKYGNV